MDRAKKKSTVLDAVKAYFQVLKKQQKNSSKCCSYLPGKGLQ